METKIYQRLLQALLSSPTSCSSVSFHTTLVRNFSWYSPKWSQDWPSRVNLECKILQLFNNNFAWVENEGFPKSQWESSAFGRITCINYTGYVQNFGSKIQDFFQTIPKQQFIFPDSRLPNNYMIKRDLEKCRNQAFFFRMQCKLTKTTMQCRHSGSLWLSWLRARLNGIWPIKKKFTYWALVVTLKKKTKKNQTFYHFSRLYLYFRDFFQGWKIALQISRRFQEFKTLYKPFIYPLVISWHKHLLYN